MFEKQNNHLFAYFGMEIGALFNCYAIKYGIARMGPRLMIELLYLKPVAFMTNSNLFAWKEQLLICAYQFGNGIHNDVCRYAPYLQGAWLNVTNSRFAILWLGICVKVPIMHFNSTRGLFCVFISKIKSLASENASCWLVVCDSVWLQNRIDIQSRRRHERKIFAR